MQNYRHLYPKKGEANTEYTQRLETDGHEEMFIRRALRVHFEMNPEEFGAFFENFEGARLRHLALLKEQRPHRTHNSFSLKVSENLGISVNSAKRWIELFETSRFSN